MIGGKRKTKEYQQYYLIRTVEEIYVLYGLNKDHAILTSKVDDPVSVKIKSERVIKTPKK